jgi:hypothetical protein
MGEVNTARCAQETENAIFQGRPITVTHITPILTPEQRDKRKREIESQLYEVFSKYANGGKPRKAG